MTTRKITHYGIVVKEYSHDLVSLVSKMIIDGWQPYGPPIAINDPDSGVLIYQTMVIYEKAEAL